MMQDLITIAIVAFSLITIVTVAYLIGIELPYRRDRRIRQREREASPLYGSDLPLDIKSAILDEDVPAAELPKMVDRWLDPPKTKKPKKPVPAPPKNSKNCQCEACKTLRRAKKQTFIDPAGYFIRCTCEIEEYSIYAFGEERPIRKVVTDYCEVHHL